MGFTDALNPVTSADFLTLIGSGVQGFPIHIVIMFGCVTECGRSSKIVPDLCSLSSYKSAEISVSTRFPGNYEEQPDECQVKGIEELDAQEQCAGVLRVFC